MIAVAVAGAAGRMGQAVCGAVQAAPDMELVARADPALETSVAEALEARPDRAKERGAEEPDPQEERRGACEVRLEANGGVGARERQQDRRELDDHDHAERGARGAQIRQIERSLAHADRAGDERLTRGMGNALPKRRDYAATAAADP